VTVAAMLTRLSLIHPIADRKPWPGTSSGTNTPVNTKPRWQVGTDSPHLTGDGDARQYRNPRERR
jgi:hypothetical protein